MRRVLGDERRRTQELLADVIGFGETSADDPVTIDLARLGDTACRRRHEPVGGRLTVMMGSPPIR